MRTTRRPSLTLAGLASALLLVLPLSACGSDDDGDGADGGGEITVLAAASLTETFTELADDFEADHDGVEVTLAFDSSATLAQQALDGAPADVLATADTRTMDDATDALDGDSQLFATNKLVMVTPADNPAGLTRFDDLESSDAQYVVCVPDAPCGALAASLLEENGVTAEPVSQEVDVKSTLARVVSGDADAGFVYATDAVAAGDDVQVFDVPGAENMLNDYPIGLLQQSDDSDLAQEFIDLVLSSDGQQVLTEAGFGTP